MAQPNAFRPTVPEPDSSYTTAPTATPVQGNIPKKTTGRPSSSTDSGTGKDKFKAILQKKSAPEAQLVDDTAEEVSESTTGIATSPFDLAAEPQVQKGKGKMFFFSDTELTEGSKTAAAPTVPGFADVDNTTAQIDEGEEAAITQASSKKPGAGPGAGIEKTASTHEPTENVLLPSTGSIANAEDIKNLQLFTREDMLKAFASWENKKNSSTNLAVGDQATDASQIQAPVAGITQIDVSAQKSGTDSSVAAQQQARETRAQLVDQLVKALSQVTSTDRTETTLTLKYPPIFEGVSITVTEFKTAQKEFNVTFFNLTNPTARLLIETKQNQDSLRSSLIEKGYTLQMITIEPKLDISTSTTTSQDNKRQGQQGKGSYGQGNSPQGGFGAGG